MPTSSEVRLRMLKINSIDISGATEMDGVIAVYTGEDVVNADGVPYGVPCGWQVNFKNGDTMKEPPHPLLVSDKARHMGDAVAMVIAESKAIAQRCCRKCSSGLRTTSGSHRYGYRSF